MRRKSERKRVKVFVSLQKFFPVGKSECSSLLTVLARITILTPGPLAPHFTRAITKRYIPGCGSASTKKKLFKSALPHDPTLTFLDTEVQSRTAIEVGERRKEVKNSHSDVRKSSNRYVTSEFVRRGLYVFHIK